MRTSTLFVAFLIISTLSFGQKPLYTHQQWFKVEDGLPQGFISGLAQDDDGFIWISTLGGLARYDGRSFRLFHQGGDDSSGISSNVIIQMVYSSYKQLWLLSQGHQVDAFNPVTLRLYKKALSKLLEFQKKHEVTVNEYGGKYWTYLNNDEVGWIDLSTFKTGTASIRNGMLKDNAIRTIAYQPDGKLILLSNKSIQVSDSNRQEFSYIPLQQPLPADLYINKTGLWETMGDNMVLIGGERLWFINYRNGEVKNFAIPEASDMSTNFQSIRKGLDGRLYARSFSSVYRVNADGSMTLLWKNNVLPGRNLITFLVDRSEVLWVGLDVGGLVKVNLKSMPMNAHSYKHNFHTDVLVELGVPLEQIPAHWKSGMWAYGFRYSYGKDSTLYVSFSELIPQYAVYGYRNKKLFPLPFPSPYQQVQIRGLATDSSGGIWAIDELNKGIWYWRNDRSIPEFYPTTMFTAPSDNIAYLCVSNNLQWVTTYGQGMFLLKNGKTIEHLDKNSRPNNIPYDLTEIYQDPNNPDRLWIGSRGEGLLLWDKNKKLIRKFTQADGLPNNTVYCIVPDKLGKLWLTTNKGICRFDPLKYEFYNFEKSDGLPGNEFNRSHEFRFPDGRIALGGIDGYVIFQPADFSYLKTDAPIGLQITEVTINNRVLNYSDSEELLKVPLSQLKELILPYNKTNISLSFAALQFNEPQKIRYRYRLKGFSDDWVETGHNNTAYYTHLDPGEYELEINATNLDGKWSNDFKILSLQVLPPIWKTWWAYGLYFLILVAAILYYLKYRERRLKAQQQLLFEQKESERLRELDEVKTRFFSNITHEFRTPLTLVTAPLEKLSQDPRMPSPLLQTVHVIQRNANKLLGLINQLLDLSKLEAGQMEIHHSTGNISEFVNDSVQSFADSALEKKIRLVFSSNNVKGLYRFDVEKWERIISNLLSNAIKFTPENGEVIVTLSPLGVNAVQLRVQDTGLGVPADQQHKIFDRFYQVDTSATRKYEGTGIGLSLVKELTRLMGGTVHVENAVPNGALFIVTLPVESLEGVNIENGIDSSSSKYHGHISDSGIMVDREKPLVLLVEDNEEMRQFIAETLSPKWDIIQAANGKIAQEMIMQDMPDLVVSDVMMPGMDGFELCRQTKTNLLTAHIGFILLTAKAGHGNKVVGLETGADDYITKPFHIDELMLRIQNLLQLQVKMRAHLQAQLLPVSPTEKPAIVINPFLKELYTILDQQLDDPQLGVEQLAAHLNMSKSTLNRKLKSLLDISANDLIRRYRLQKSINFLKEGLDISTVAYKSGFSSPSYFSQCFKEQYNLTPSQFSVNRE